MSGDVAAARELHCVSSIFKFPRDSAAGIELHAYFNFSIQHNASTTSADLAISI
jgi:hypothetical protein